MAEIIFIFKFLMVVMIVNIVGVIIAILVACLSDSPGTGAGIQMDIASDTPKVLENTEPPVEHTDIADQLDGRLTNVFKNPMKGIL